MRVQKAGQARGRPSRGRGTPFKLVVLAIDTADAVTAAGGLIVDSVRAGWTVDLYLETPTKERALRILGVEGRTLPTIFDFEPEWPDAVFMAAGLLKRHTGARRLVADAARHHRADIAVWGDSGPADLGAPNGTEHRLSSAAKAFKLHALSAVESVPHVSPTETFLSRQRRTTGAHAALPRT
jgi:hypothetical protein